MKTAFVIPTRDRLPYLESCLDCISKTTVSWPIYVMVDGGDVAKTVELAEKFPRTTCVVRHTPIGLGRSLIETRRFAFENLSLDRMMLVENDVRISRELPILLEHVLEWSKSYGRWPAVALSFIEDLSDKATGLFTWWNGWYAALIPKEAWLKTYDVLDEYRSLFLMAGLYEYRDCKAITEWARLKFHVESPQTSQDAMHTYAMFYRGVWMYTTGKRRAVHTGIRVEGPTQYPISNTDDIVHASFTVLDAAKELAALYR